MHFRQQDKEFEMAEEIKQWEYRVQTVGSFWSGVKADELEQFLKNGVMKAGRLFRHTSLKM